MEDVDDDVGGSSYRVSMVVIKVAQASLVGGCVVYVKAYPVQEMQISKAYLCQPTDHRFEAPLSTIKATHTT